MWPVDNQGRDWPEGRDGQPEYPIHQLPVGFAPGTNAIYRVLAESEARRQAATAAAMADNPLTAATLVQVTVEGVEAVVALAALPEFLAGMDIGVSVAMVIGSARYRFANTGVVQDWSRELPGRRAHADAFPEHQGTNHDATRIIQINAPGEDEEPPPAFLEGLRELRLGAIEREGFTEAESNIIVDAQDILRSPEFQKLRVKTEGGLSKNPHEIQVNGYTILYEPTLPPGYSGITLSGENGFAIGPDAKKRLG